MPEQRQWPFSKPMEFLQKVKYGGAVGKLTVIAVAAILAFCVAMTAMWGQAPVAFASIAAIVVIVLLSFREIRRTLDKNPELALMDGTEIVAYRRVELAAKNRSVLHVAASPIADPTPSPKMIEPAASDEEE